MITVKRAVSALFLALVLTTTALPVFAADETPVATETAEPAAPQGGSMAIMLLGLGSIAAVGLVMLNRDQFNSAPKS